MFRLYLNYWHIDSRRESVLNDKKNFLWHLLLRCLIRKWILYGEQKRDRDREREREKNFLHIELQQSDNYTIFRSWWKFFVKLDIVGVSKENTA